MSCTTPTIPALVRVGRWSELEVETENKPVEMESGLGVETKSGLEVKTENKLEVKTKMVLSRMAFCKGISKGFQWIQ